MRRHTSGGTWPHTLALGAALAASLSASASGQERVGEVARTRIETPHPCPAGDPDRGPVWRATVRHPGATFLKVHFAALAVRGAMRGGRPVGDYVVLRNADDTEREVVTGTHHQGFWASSVPGEQVTVELHAGRGGDYGLLIDRYAYGTAPVDSLRGPEVESICGTDDKRPLCDASVFGRIRRSDPVVRLLVVDDCGGVNACTGFLFAADGRLMTNAHCADSDEEARSMEAWFNYVDDAAPSGPCSRPDRPNPDVFRGAQYLEKVCDLDVGVHRLLDPVKGNPAAIYGHLSLDARAPSAGEPVWVPQHPGGRAREIAETNAQVVVEAVEGTDFCADPPAGCARGGIPTGSMTEFGHTADTEPGSSGAPVLDGNDLVIGLHHESGCSGGMGSNRAVAMGPILSAVPTGPVLVIDRLVLSSAAGGRLSLRADFSLDGSATFDPPGQAVELSVASPGGVVFDASVPAGSFPPSATGRRWSYRASGSATPALARVTLTSLGGLGYRVSATARGVDAALASNATVDAALTIGEDRFSAAHVACTLAGARTSCTR